jgi:chloramphenicol 3-O-phosphotransferase
MMPENWTDEELLAELAEALRAEQEVPAALIHSGKAVWTWRTVDAELAALTYDSAVETSHAELVMIRSEAAALRSLTYASTHLTIDLEVTRDALLGQMQPAEVVSAEVVSRDGAVLPVEVDEVGWFTVRPAPRSPFRISCTTHAGSVKVVTAWIEL